MVKIPVQVTSFLPTEDAKYPPKSRKALGSLSMCATRSRQSYGGAHRDSNRDHSHPAVQAPHPVPYPFYPPPHSYPRCPLYDPYATYHYPGSFYLTPYCAQHDITKEEPAVWSWSTVALLILLVVGAFVIVFRSFFRETRRKIVAWLRSPRFTQVIPSPGLFHSRGLAELIRSDRKTRYRGFKLLRVDLDLIILML